MPTKVVVRFKECIDVFARLSCFFVGAAALDEIQRGNIKNQPQWNEVCGY